MIRLTTATKIQNAINKARTVKPFVRVNCFGSYSVTNRQTGATYTVTCEKRDGERFADCTCHAGTRGQACYHVAAAAGTHIVIAAERAATSSC